MRTSVLQGEVTSLCIAMHASVLPGERVPHCGRCDGGGGGGGGFRLLKDTSSWSHTHSAASTKSTLPRSTSAALACAAKSTVQSSAMQAANPVTQPALVKRAPAMLHECEPTAHRNRHERQVARTGCSTSVTAADLAGIRPGALGKDRAGAPCGVACCVDVSRHVGAQRVVRDGFNVCHIHAPVHPAMRINHPRA
jgi:hypothetical protein